jgi:hypothetical protein
MSKTIAIALLCGILCTILAFAQQKPQGTIIRVPAERGVYYDGPSGLIALPTRVFMPMQRGAWRNFLGLGAVRLTAVVPGANASLAILDPRPTFYLRGERPGNETYLVQGSQREDHREFHMTRDSGFEAWMRFRQKDLADVEVEPLGADLVRLRPRARLEPGEYAIVAVLEPRFRAIRLAFDFGIPRVTP